MKKMDSLWADAVLTVADYKLLKQKVIETPIWGLASRKVLPVKRIDSAAQVYQYQVLSDYGSAETIRPNGDFPGLQLDGTLSDVNIAKIGVGFGVSREDVLASRRSGMPLDSKNAEIASQQVQKKENYVVWNGDTNFGITGILNESSLATYSSAGWGSGDVYDDIRQAIAQVQDEYSDRRFGLVCHRDNYSMLLRKNTNTDKSYISMIRDELNVTPVMDVNQTSGTALLIPEGNDITELLVAEELDMEMDYEKAKNQSYSGLVFLRSAPVVYVPAAIVKITGA